MEFFEAISNIMDRRDVDVTVLDFIDNTALTTSNLEIL